MIDKEALADLIIERLNEIATHDQEALYRILTHRTTCNDALAKHPTVQVRGKDGTYSVSALGIINGLIGIIDDGGKRDGWGHIVAVVDEDPSKETIRFVRTTGGDDL